eukprot:CAMPEP_0198431138 /NCGR_PEP_ID=MMETSP1452-20131203/17608_1 /TAXON_ID=1181717 /ORGANISM="Synchroma pusillum, Strain CCMP3072" /LENGTH=340 /DNA_ID=CAMNT_0044151593 /DNA_START=10 /DNA_END=1029 /DNA_ORIENTATION=-
MWSMKILSLVCLVVQNTTLVLLMRHSRTVEGPLYAASTAVLLMELLKLAACLGVLLSDCHWSLAEMARVLQSEVLDKPREVAKLSVPSLLYTVQNQLLYFALSNLDAATYQVTYQIKTLSTAGFSVLLLGRRLAWRQWMALVVLTCGAALAQLGSMPQVEEKRRTSVEGFIAVLLAACTSGFSGAYFERVLKGSSTSLMVRNIQLGLPSCAAALFSVYVRDWDRVLTQGFFHGYNMEVAVVIVLQAVGGLVVAIVVKYADSILKGFAASFSIVTSCVLSVYLFEFEPSPTFVLGAVLVNASMWLYANHQFCAGGGGDVASKPTSKPSLKSQPPSPSPQGM